VILTLGGKRWCAEIPQNQIRNGTQRARGKARDAPAACPCIDEFTSTWEAIQKVVFERHGCTSELCHGAAPGQGDLDLRPDVAWSALVGVASAADPDMLRVKPGDSNHSLLWRKLAARTLGGEVFFLAAMSVGLWLNWRPTLAVFVFPYVFVRFLMMFGNWGQHAFVDAARPASPYVNSITCINSRYNRRCFNDGYHIGHHVKATRHWSEMPEDFQRNVDTYAKEGAIVFEGIDFFMVWLLLMTGSWRRLARAYVRLPGAPERTEEEIIVLLKERVRPILREGRAAQAQAA
jgi:hypothetical protein